MSNVLSSERNLLETSLRKVRSKIERMKLQDLKSIPKSPKEMTLAEFATDTMRRRELNELFMKQKSIENQIAALNKPTK